MVESGPQGAGAGCRFRGVGEHRAGDAARDHGLAPVLDLTRRPARPPVSPHRVEALSLDAWPTLRQQDYDGWLLRFARGYTRRANSVNPQRRGRLALDDKLAACERAYRAEGLKLVFRIPSIAEEAELDEALAARGYEKADTTGVRLLDLAGFDASAADPALAAPLSDAWLAALARFNAMTVSQQATHRAILGALAEPARFAAVEDAGAIASVAFAVLQDGFVCLNSIATDAAKRRRGHAHRAIAALLAWAKQQGAAYAYLPVVKTNHPGLALYNGLGFRTELYRYHYRSRPA